MKRDFMQTNEEAFFKNRISFIPSMFGIRVEIETRRLYIRSYDARDYENCISLYGDEKLTKYFDGGKPRSKNEVENLVNEKGVKYFRDGIPFGLFSIFNKENMTFIGQIDLIPFDNKGTVEIGFILLREYHNQGFCQEATRAFILDYVNELNRSPFKFFQIPITKIVATTHPENYASKRVMEYVGMNFEKSLNRFNQPRLMFSYIPKTSNQNTGDDFHGR